MPEGLPKEQNRGTHAHQPPLGSNSAALNAQIIIVPLLISYNRLPIITVICFHASCFSLLLLPFGSKRLMGPSFPRSQLAFERVLYQLFFLMKGGGATIFCAEQTLDEGAFPGNKRSSGILSMDVVTIVASLFISSTYTVLRCLCQFIRQRRRFCKSIDPSFSRFSSVFKTWFSLCSSSTDLPLNSEGLRSIFLLSLWSLLLASPPFLFCTSTSKQWLQQEKKGSIKFQKLLKDATFILSSSLLLSSSPMNWAISQKRELKRAHMRAFPLHKCQFQEGASRCWAEEALFTFTLSTGCLLYLVFIKPTIISSE